MEVALNLKFDKESTFWKRQNVLVVEEKLVPCDFQAV